MRHTCLLPLGGCSPPHGETVRNDGWRARHSEHFTALLRGFERKKLGCRGGSGTALPPRLLDRPGAGGSASPLPPRLLDRPGAGGSGNPPPPPVLYPPGAGGLRAAPPP